MIARTIAATVAIALLLSVDAQVQQPRFRGRVDAVQLDVSVTRDGKPVTGLNANDFVVTDNGKLQIVTTEMVADVPLRITLVLDVSASVQGERLSHLIGAAQKLADALHAEDEVALVTFSHAVLLRVPAGAPAGELRNALTSLRAVGNTSLRDAVQLSLLLRPAERMRALLLLFSDGVDNLSWTPTSQVIDTARRSNVVVHSIIASGARAFADSLAAETGGRVWSAESDRQLETLFSQALDEMRSRYVLTYALPDDAVRGWHEIKVSVRNTSGHVTARPGYLVQ